MAKVQALECKYKSENEVSEEVEEVLHLKSFCSMCGDNNVLVGGPLGWVFAHWINSNIYPSIGSNDNRGSGRISASNDGGSDVIGFPYKIIHVPDAAAANCVFVNGTVVRRAGTEFPASASILRMQLDPKLKQIEVEAGELAKVDGALSCCSVIL